MRSIRNSILSLFVIMFTSQGNEVVAQHAMQTPRPIPTPVKIRRLVKGNIAETQTIDFDGDKKPDFIVFVRNNNPLNYDVIGTELWITSGSKIVKRQPKYNAGADFKWFINLDDDPVPEIISAFGYEDGIAYSIYKQDFKVKDILLLQFNPVIDASDEGKHYWGYPWDIIDIRAKRRGNHYEILCSFNHNVEGDFDNIDIGEMAAMDSYSFLQRKDNPASGCSR